MRKLLITKLIWFCLYIGCAQTGWLELNTSAIVKFNSFAFSGSQGKTIGDSGKIYTYPTSLFENTGTWTLENTGTIRNLKDILLVGTNVWHVVGDSGLVLTKTGTGPWILSNAGTSKNLTANWTPATSIHLAVGDSGTIVRSVNAGVSWTAITSPVYEDLKDIAFFAAGSGIAVGKNGTIILTTDTGISWQTISSGINEDLNAIHVYNSTTAYICGKNGTILKTTNAGVSWSLVATPFNFDFNTVLFINATKGFVAGTDGRILQTLNSGTTWSEMISGPTNINKLNNFGSSLYAVSDSGRIQDAVNYEWLPLHFNEPLSGSSCGAFLDSTYGFVHNNSNIYRTINGKHFKKISTIPSSTYYSMSFVSKSTGFISGNDIYMTTDSGYTWSNITNNLSAITYFPKIRFFSATDGIAMSEHSMHRTTNAGVTWQSFPWFSNFFQLEEMYFYNKDTGYVDYSDFIYQTKDGCNSWTPVFGKNSTSSSWPRLTSSDINNVYNYSQYATTLSRTRDGGRNWHTMDVNIPNMNTNNNGIEKLHFIDTLTGYVFYQTNTMSNYGIAKTSGNISAAFTQQSMPNYINASNPEFHFPDKNHGFFIHDVGVLKNVNSDAYIGSPVAVTDSFVREKTPSYEWFFPNPAGATCGSNFRTVTSDSSGFIIFGGTFDNSGPNYFFKIDTLTFPKMDINYYGGFIAKIDSEKKIMWGKSISAAGMHIEKTRCFKSNDIFFAGSFHGDTVFMGNKDSIILLGTNLPPPSRAFMGLYDSTGKLLKFAGLPYRDFILDFYLHDSLIYIVGTHDVNDSIDSIVFTGFGDHIIALNKTFQVKWYRTFDVPSLVNFRRIALNSNGEIYVAGSAASQIDGIFPSPNNQPYLVKLDSSTHIAQWSKEFINVACDHIKLEPDNNGGITAAGFFGHPADIDGNWVSTPYTNYILSVLGSCYSQGEGRSIFITNVNSSGTTNWVNRTVSSEFNSSDRFGFSKDEEDSYYITTSLEKKGLFADSLVDLSQFISGHGYITKFDKNGKLKWVNTISSTFSAGTNDGPIFTDIACIPHDHSVYFTITAPGTNFNLYGTYNASTLNNQRVGEICKIKSGHMYSTQYYNQNFNVCYGDSLSIGDSTFHATGTYTVVLNGIAGNDSVVIASVAVDPAIDTSVSINSYTLSANQSGAAYQWIDCNNNYLPIAGETAQAFTPGSAGEYAVIINFSGCTDTSSCNVVAVGINEINPKPYEIRPNPAKDFFIIENISVGSTIKLYDIIGRLIFVQKSNSEKCVLNTSNLQNGIFLVEVGNEISSSFQRIVINR